MHTTQHLKWLGIVMLAMTILPGAMFAADSAYSGEVEYGEGPGTVVDEWC